LPHLIDLVTAVSSILVATTLGAVAGPNLVAPVGRLSERNGIPALAGPFAVSALAYALAALVLFVWLRPDPLLTARAYATDSSQQRRADRPAGLHTDTAALWVSGLTMVVTQLVMVAVMTMTPVHMRDHSQGLGATGLVIRLHIAAMFLPSPLTGRLADRYGSKPVASAAAVAFLAAGLTAAAASPHAVAPLATALVLLGLGWNLGLLAGTTLVVGATPLHGRARVQGRLDVAIALAGATGGLSSGFVMAATSYGTLAVGGGVLALAVLAVALRPVTTAHAYRSSPSGGEKRGKGTRMRAVVVEQFGGPAVLRSVEAERPVPGPSQLLVEVSMAGVTYVDVYRRTGATPLRAPFFAGVEGVGTIVSVGEAVADFSAGQRVGWMSGGQGQLLGLHAGRRS
jgi:MFS family permease